MHSRYMHTWSKELLYYWNSIVSFYSFYSFFFFFFFFFNFLGDDRFSSLLNWFSLTFDLFNSICFLLFFVVVVVDDAVGCFNDPIGAATMSILRGTVLHILPMVNGLVFLPWAARASAANRVPRVPRGTAFAWPTSHPTWVVSLLSDGVLPNTVPMGAESSPNPMEECWSEGNVVPVVPWWMTMILLRWYGVRLTLERWLDLGFGSEVAY